MAEFLGILFIGTVAYFILKKIFSEIPSMQRERELKRLEKELEEYSGYEKAIEESIDEARKRAKELEKSLRKEKAIVSQEEISVEAVSSSMLTKVPRNKVSPRGVTNTEEFNVNKKETPKQSLEKYKGRDPIIKCYKFVEAVVVVCNPQGLNLLIQLTDSCLNNGIGEKVTVSEEDSVPYVFSIKVSKNNTGLEVSPSYEEGDYVEFSGTKENIKSLKELFRKVFQKNKTHKGFFRTNSGHEFEVQVLCINEGIGGDIWNKFPYHYEANFEEYPDKRKAIIKKFMI